MLLTEVRDGRGAIRLMKQAWGLMTLHEIRAPKHSLGLSQAAFEKLIGVGPETVVRWENGIVFRARPPTGS